MPITPTYPGVYVEEIPSGVRTIIGSSTSITAFIGRALRGPVNEPVRIQSFADFERKFGGLRVESTMSYAVHHFFLNGGADAIVVRVHNTATPATLNLPAGNRTLSLIAANEGSWGNNLRAIIDHKTKDPEDVNLFNLVIKEVVSPKSKEARATETFLNISRDENSERFITKVLEQDSALVRVGQGIIPPDRPDDSKGNEIDANDDGKDGSELNSENISDPNLKGKKEGIWALEKVNHFNLLCIPPFTFKKDVDQNTLSNALKYCKDRRAMLIVDPPSAWNDVSKVHLEELDLQDEKATNAVIFFPRLKMRDPLKENRLGEFVPCGAVAGIFARNDSQRGVWKAPAGIEATLTGVADLTVKITDGDNGQLSPMGVNCLRTFQVIGHAIWGARTLRGADQLASEWKYIPIRRLALYIEETLYRNTQWVVFEPNDEPLWAQIRLNIGAFMHDLFRQGAFQGKTPREAYFVRCDKETTTQNDINKGIVNILVGFAPLKPAEFVMIKIQQMAGQIQT